MRVAEVLAACLCACAVVAAPGRSVPAASDAERAETPPSNFIGEGTNVLTSAMLLGYEQQEDFVFSPLGYSVILAIMAEGARGETRNQLVSALHLPEDTYAVRQNYKQILGSMRERWSDNKPEFKNWFYVYKNFTVDETYKKVLLENYFTEVKHVERINYEIDFNSEMTEENKTEESNADTDNSDGVRRIDDKVKENGEVDIKSSDEQNASEYTLNEQTNAKEVLTSKHEENINEEREEKNKEERTTTTTDESKETKESVKVKYIKESQVNGIRTEEKINKKKYEKEAIKSEEETNESKKPSVFDGKKDVADALTTTPMFDRNSQEESLDSETKMIVFNGFYFRGTWKTPFVPANDDEKRSFYTSPTEKKLVAMMQTTGVFSIGSLPGLNAVALEMPYEGGQYSMLVLLPDQRDGLAKLISDMHQFSLNRVYKHLTDRPVQVVMPKCQIQTISRPKEILQKFEVKDLFNENADLSGISLDSLKMGDLVQLVNVQIDEGSADTNFLTAVNAASFGATRNNAESFIADHPFLFFIRDHTKNLIIAAGKVIDPKFSKNEQLIKFSTKKM